jgi:hypothetical protein
VAAPAGALSLVEGCSLGEALGLAVSLLGAPLACVGEAVADGEVEGLGGGAALLAGCAGLDGAGRSATGAEAEGTASETYQLVSWAIRDSMSIAYGRVRRWIWVYSERRFRRRSGGRVITTCGCKSA